MVIITVTEVVGLEEEANRRLSARSPHSWLPGQRRALRGALESSDVASRLTAVAFLTKDRADQFIVRNHHYGPTIVGLRRQAVLVGAVLDTLDTCPKRVPHIQ